MLDASLWYVQNGLPVFPVHSIRGGFCSCGNPECEHPGKHPRTSRGFKDATKDPEQVRRLWEKWPDANIGIPTGRDSDLLVVDIDPRNNGDDSWEKLIREYGSIPDTAEQVTGGDGRHILFRDAGIPVPKELAPGIDIKSTGGYIIAAPSLHLSGNRYQWDGIAGKNALLHRAPAPAWLLERLAANRKEKRSAPESAANPFRSGERNVKLTSLAGTMRRRGMGQEAIEAALQKENRRRCVPPLAEEEVRRIAASVARYPPDSESTKQATTPFRLSEDAVIFIDPDPDKEPLRVCGRLEVAAQTRDGAGDGWGRLLKWRDLEGRQHAWAMPMSQLAGDGNEYRSRLLDGGLMISPGRKVRDLLTTYIQTAVTKERMLCVPRIGWHGESFVLPTETVGATGSEQVIFQTTHEMEHSLEIAGTLDDWKQNVAHRCSGNSRLLFAVSCSFAGPLLALAGAESGGIHFVGKSSTGKTSMLCAAGSVNGGGRGGFVKSWRTTANGLEAIADLHNDLTLLLDELSQVDPREAAEAAYLLANGRGKSRMSRSIGSRKAATWRLLFMSAGELTLADHALSVGKRVRGGAEVRLLNIDADAGAHMGVFENLHGAPSPDVFSEQIKDAAAHFYGVPLRELLKFLTANRPAVEKALRNFQSDFVPRNVPKKASGEVYRAAQRFGLIAAAGELATEAGITGWRPEEATAAAENCFRSWLARRGTTGAGDSVAMVRQVRRFLEAHGPSRFEIIRNAYGAGQDDGASEAQLIRDRAGFRRKNQDTGETDYLILQEVFKAEVCSGFDYLAVREALDEQEFLTREHPHWTVKPRKLPEMPPSVRVYCIPAKILESTE